MELTITDSSVRFPVLWLTPFHHFQTVCKVRGLIPAEIRPLVRYAKYLSSNDCLKPSASFTAYAYGLLDDDSISEPEFNPCDYIPELQEALNFAPNANASTFVDLVVLPDDAPLSSTLRGLWSPNVTFSGELLLEEFGVFSVSINALLFTEAV